MWFYLYSLELYLGELLTHNYNPLEAITALLDDFVALFSEAWITNYTICSIGWGR